VQFPRELREGTGLGDDELRRRLRRHRTTLIGQLYLVTGDLEVTSVDSVRQQVPLVVAYGAGEPGTTSMGLEWADGTKVVNAMRDVEGNPMAALAFDPAQSPSYLLEFGSYGEYRIPPTNLTRYTWTFGWPN